MDFKQHYRCSFAPLGTQENVGGKGYGLALAPLFQPMRSTDSSPPLPSLSTDYLSEKSTVEARGGLKMVSDLREN